MACTFAKEDLVATMRCQPGAAIPCKLDWPIERIKYFGADPADTRRRGEPIWTDQWGVTWQKESQDPQMMPFPTKHPLSACLNNLGDYQWPDADAQTLFVDLNHRQPNPEHLLVGTHPFALFERAWLLMGMQPLLLAMAEIPEQVELLFERIADFEQRIARQYLNIGVEAAWIADDYGMNSSLLFSIDMWRRFVRPHLQRMVDLYHEADVIVALHSCGNITPLVDEFLDLGIDVLDPIQPNCNDLATLRSKTRGRICLCGGVESSVLLAENTLQTQSDTQRLIDELGQDGGFIVGPDDDWTFPTIAADAMLAVVRSHRERSDTQRA